MPEFEEYDEQRGTERVRSWVEKFSDGFSLIPGHLASDPEAGTDLRGLIFRREGATGVADKFFHWGRNALDALAGREFLVHGLNEFYIRNAANVTLGNVTTAQSPFTAANDTMTVEAATLYHFETMIATVQGTTSHTLAFGAGGTATFTNITHFAEHISVTDATLASNDVDHKLTKLTTAFTATVVSPAITATGTILKVKGSFLTNAAGTLIPQITFSADPTGTCEAHLGSYFMAKKMPSGAIGPFA